VTGEPTPTPAEVLLLQLGMVARPGELVEVRYRRPQGGMGQLFQSADRARSLIETVLGLGERTDTYVGAAPRMARDGSKRAVTHSHALWVDCDDPDAADRLRAFVPAPTLLLRSGRDGGLHGWWALREPLAAPAALERALRRVAHHLGGDMACCDAGRIMRAAGTLNHKHGQARPVEVERLEPGAIYTAADVVGDLPDPPARVAPPAARQRHRTGADDPLLGIPATIYVPALTGQGVGRDGKAHCPFHADRTPSLHAYPTAAEGWTCFAGCGAGTIIDFGAKLYDLEPRGTGYHRIRERLEADLRGRAAA